MKENNIINKMENKRAIDIIRTSIFKKVISEELEKTTRKKINIDERIFRLGFIRRVILKRLPLRLKKTVRYFLEWQKDSQYFPALDEKRRSLDFLEYVLSNDPEIPYDCFPKSDWKAIDKFVKNKFLIAIFERLDKNYLFDNQDIERQNHYKYFLKSHPIIKKKDYYEFLGFKSVVNNIFPDIFVEECGLNYLKNKERLIDSTIIDCGACIGDSTYILNQKLSPKKIVAVEPEPTNYNKLLKNIHLNKMNNVIPVSKGVGEKQGSFYMEFGGAGAYLSSRGTKQKVEVDSIDNLIKELALKNIGLIKMDIEGFESPAIKGAKEIIKKFKPALIICLYHRGQDFFEIPKLVKELVPQYKFQFVNLSEEFPTHERVLIAEY